MLRLSSSPAGCSGTGNGLVSSHKALGNHSQEGLVPVGFCPGLPARLVRGRCSHFGPKRVQGERTGRLSSEIPPGTGHRGL